MQFSRYKIKTKQFVVALDSATLRPGHGHSPYKSSKLRLLLCEHNANSLFNFCTPNCLHGDGEIRTLDPLLARQVLSQLSYTPTTVFTVQCLYSSVFFAVTDNRLLQWA